MWTSIEFLSGKAMNYKLKNISEIRLNYVEGKLSSNDIETIFNHSYDKLIEELNNYGEPSLNNSPYIVNKNLIIYPSNRFVYSETGEKFDTTFKIELNEPFFSLIKEWAKQRPKKELSDHYLSAYNQFYYGFKKYNLTPVTPKPFDIDFIQSRKLSNIKKIIYELCSSSQLGYQVFEKLLNKKQ